MGTPQPSDAELLTRLRSGDSAAFALLRERYTRTVGQPTVDLEEVPEGLRGEPPDGCDPVERAVVLEAYATLPERTRAVLWLTEVEGRPPAVVGTSLGMTPPAAAALVSRAGDQLRHAYLRARLRAMPRPRCGRPHRSRLAGYVRHGAGDGVRTEAAAHIDGCSSCRALVAAVGEAPRLFARALLPWSAPERSSPRAPLSGSRPVRALAGAGRHGRHAAAVARGDPALTGTVAVAAALVVAVLAAAFLPGRAPTEVASRRSARSDQEVIVPSPPRPPPISSDRGLAPSTTVPGPVAARPVDPAVAAPPPPVRPEPDRGVPATAPPRQPPPSAGAVSTTTVPPSTVPPSTVPVTPRAGISAPDGGDDVIGVATAPSVPSVSSAVWQPTGSRVEVTLVNAGVSSTGFLVMTLEAAGGALVGAQPTGCALALGMVTRGLCTLRPLRPGASAVVRVPMTVTRPGQSAEVRVCSVAFLRLGCETTLLAPTVVSLA